jgi:hypothetical protein
MAAIQARQTLGRLVRAALSLMTRPTSQAQAESAITQLIPGEIKDDAFAATIRSIARRPDVKTVLEIGSSAGEGSTAAFVAGLREHPEDVKLFCMEVSRPRYQALRERYAADAFVHCYNASSVSLEEFSTETEVVEFHRNCHSNLNQYPLEQVIGWLAQDVRYVRESGAPGDGIEQIKREHRIDHFDVVLIDGSEFTGAAELRHVDGARFLLLDDICTFKNHANHERLLHDGRYRLLGEGREVRNGFSAFERVA